MKKALLLIISLFLLATTAYAYETVLVDFPPNEPWEAVYHERQGSEHILQYVPRGQSAESWTRTMIFHSYKIANGGGSASSLMNRTTGQMESMNNSSLYTYLKYTAVDSIATRCVKGNSYVSTQCEIYRTSKSYEGIMSMHYINKNKADFDKNFNKWYKIVKDIRIYRSYFRDNRVLDKATTFEL